MLVESTPTSVPSLVEKQRIFFGSGRTQPIEFRRTQLQRLKDAIAQFEIAIVKAACADLGRPEFEAYFEMAPIQEINVALKQLKTWMQPKRVRAPIDQFPATAWVQSDPLGVVLIIAPWNYPFQLMMSPLVGAIAAGNCAILKPSEQAPHTAKVVAELIRSTFSPNYIAVVEGDASVSQALLAEKFDHIFFTGSTAIGRIVMQAAAQHLTPVTLELGGKSPCIVDADVQLDYAAKRIAWGKFINAGQTCIAPDYLLVDRRIKFELIELLKRSIHEFYGEDPAESPDYGRIINQHHFQRLSQLLNNGECVVGGTVDPTTRYIAPTILDRVSWDDPVMQEEIFGPILPVLAYDDLSDAIAQVNACPKPLALYFFSKDPHKQERVLRSTASGGVCLNDTVVQGSLTHLPFGGVGESGMGRYHGRASFETFSHPKSVLKKSFWLDLALRYAPYTTTALKFVRYLMTR